MVRVVDESQHRPIDDDVEQLFDYLDAHREGITYVDAESEFDWARRYFYKVVFEFRKLFATDSETLVCIRDEANRKGPWIYKWVTVFESEDMNEWTSTRVDNMKSQLFSLENVSRSAMKVWPDGRTTEGKVVRLINMVTRHAREMIEQLG